MVLTLLFIVLLLETGPFDVRLIPLCMLFCGVPKETFMTIDSFMQRNLQLTTLGFCFRAAADSSLHACQQHLPGAVRHFLDPTALHSKIMICPARHILHACP